MKLTRKIKRTAAVLMLTVMSIFSIISITPAVADNNPATWILCGDDTGKYIYNAVTTDMIAYNFRSKSSSATVDSVTGSLSNQLLEFSGFDFAKVNESILGRPLNPISMPEVSQDEVNQSSEKVNPLDRFGVAGLNWTSYYGEWKYYEIDSCQKESLTSKTNFGQYYEGRMEPKSSYGEVGTSQDPRSIQFTKDMFSNITVTFIDTVSNFLFSISKVVITTTIALFGLAFTDITTLVGLTDTAVGTIFTQMFDSIFMGLVVVVVPISALYLFYKGVAKKELRMSAQAGLTSIACFVIAVIMSTNPVYWVSMPNKIATWGQGILLTGVTQSYEGSGTLCSTSAGTIVLEDNANSLEGIGHSMQSYMGCRMWEDALFKPWISGQFDATYEELNADALSLDNKDWVGSPSVPLGNGVVIDNWALFQLSTQTNAHSQLGATNVPRYINGMNADWWRVVDALSNYHEESVTVTPSGGSVSVTKMVQAINKPAEQWNHWSGNNSVQRLGVSLFAILFGIIASILPLVVSFATIMYSLLLSFFMMTAPFYLLMGTLPGKGQQVFLGWLGDIGTVMMKKIASGLLLLVVFGITTACIGLANDFGWFKSLLIMLISTMAILKNRDKIMNMLASVNFGGQGGMLGSLEKTMSTIGNTAVKGSKIATSGAAGAHAARQSGQSLQQGFKTGAMSQIRSSWYSSEIGLRAAYQYDHVKRSQEGGISGAHRCAMCYEDLSPESGNPIVFRNNDGDYFCELCAEEMDPSTISEEINHDIHEPTTLKKPKAWETKKQREKREAYNQAERDRLDKNVNVNRNTVGKKNATRNQSWVSFSKAKELMDPIYDKDGLTWNDEAVTNMIFDNMNALQRDIDLYMITSEELKNTARPSTAPEPIQEYLDTAMINEAWRNGEYDFIKDSYKKAWKTWYADNGKHIQNIDEEDMITFMNKLDNHTTRSNEDRARADHVEWSKAPKNPKPSKDEGYGYGKHEGKTVYNEMDRAGRRDEIKSEKRHRSGVDSENNIDESHK